MIKEGLQFSCRYAIYVRDEQKCACLKAHTSRTYIRRRTTQLQTSVYDMNNYCNEEYYFDGAKCLKKTCARDFQSLTIITSVLEHERVRIIHEFVTKDP